MVLILLAGCVTNLEELQKEEIYIPKNIALFSGVIEGGLYRFYFMLEDAQGNKVPAKGRAEIKIFDDSDALLFQTNFDVETQDYMNYEFKLTGQDLGKAYEKRFSVSEVQKGTSILGIGRATLTFTTPEGTSGNSETIVQIPTYTQEELAEMSENSFNENVIEINEIQTKGNFKIEVDKVGFFEFYSFGEKKEVFRVNLIATNVGSSSEYLMLSGLVLLDNKGNQYETSLFGGTFDMMAQIYPRVTKQGYFVFENVPQNTETIDLVFELGYDSNFNPFVFRYNLDLS